GGGGRGGGRRCGGGPPPHGDELPPLVHDDPSQGLERADLRRLIDRALASLPEAQRQTFVLHADAGLSYREVAEVLGISIGTVMSRLYYARQRLRAYLVQRLPPEG